MEQTAEKKQWIVLGLVSVALASGIWFMIYQQHKEIAKSRVEADLLDKSISEDRNLVKGTPDLVKAVIVQRETDTVIKEILSDTKDISNFVRTLDQFAGESGFTLESAKRQRNNRGGKEEFGRVGYTLVFEADVFQFLAFMHRLESFARFISITNFKMRAAGRMTLGDGEVARHSVTMNLETYVDKPRAVAKEARIDRYEHKRDLLIGQISEKTSKLRVPEYTYLGRRGRRDPWIDPRVPASQDGENVPIPVQLAIVERLAAQALDVRAAWETAREADNVIEAMRSRTVLEEKLALIEEEIRRIQAEAQLTYLNAERRFDKEVVEVVTGVREEMNGQGGGLGPAIALLRETVEVMERHLDVREYELALQAFSTVESKLAIAEHDPKKSELAEKLRSLRDVADAVIAFEAIALDIGGVAIQEDLRPVALINGRSVTEGELVGTELIVHHIRTDQIEFAFRGMILARFLDPDPQVTPQ
ncbi:MAG: hypothetical protein CMJ89_18315 [Planctomycetes bacterium]|jgi:Tfp pilus assembly protein PilO|nr:hypothetical protein [Planctomycetota bacterium]